MRPSYLDNGNAYIAKTASLFWNGPRALVATLPIKTWLVLQENKIISSIWTLHDCPSQINEHMMISKISSFKWLELFSKCKCLLI